MCRQEDNDVTGRGRLWSQHAILNSVVMSCCGKELQLT